MISLLSIEYIRNLHLQVMNMPSSQPLEEICFQNLDIHRLNLSQRKMVLGITTMTFPYHSKFTKYAPYYSKNYKNNFTPSKNLTPLLKKKTMSTYVSPKLHIPLIFLKFKKCNAPYHSNFILNINFIAKSIPIFTLTTPKIF